jgi:hypothetical protein
MAAGTLPKPGTEYGPCDPDCAHRDCAETRRMATENCGICQKPIGYDVRFYDEHGRDERNLVHAACLEDEAERERLARRNEAR